MPHVEFFDRLVQLSNSGEAFATATVVGRRAPVSAHLGDRAIIYADGRMEGFVGGACAREIVKRQALEAISSGASRLVSIQPDATGFESGPDRRVVPMTCASEGAVDVLIEPFVQTFQLVIVGATPIASALARLARALDYRVVRVVEERERQDVEHEEATSGCSIVPLDRLDEVLSPPPSAAHDRAVVVASQGHYDEEALAPALRAGVSYVGLVASRTRGSAVTALLEGSGVPAVARLRVPAGLDLGARAAPEVAVSILAEIVQARSTRTGVTSALDMGRSTPVPGETAIDPVCGMQVDVSAARHQAEVDGVLYYFCGAGCRARFVQTPTEYLSRSS